MTSPTDGTTESWPMLENILFFNNKLSCTLLHTSLCMGFLVKNKINNNDNDNKWSNDFDERPHRRGWFIGKL